MLELRAEHNVQLIKVDDMQLTIAIPAVQGLGMKK